MTFHEIGGFHVRARLWQSCRVVQNAEKIFFHKKKVFFLRNKNTTHVVSDIVTGVGALWGRSKPSIFIFLIKINENQWKSMNFIDLRRFLDHCVVATEVARAVARHAVVVVGTTRHRPRAVRPPQTPWGGPRDAPHFIKWPWMPLQKKLSFSHKTKQNYMPLV